MKEEERFRADPRGRELHDQGAAGGEALHDDVERRLRELEPEVEVLAVDMVGGGRSPTLRIFLDHPAGVDLDLCARATNQLRDLLRDYTVEVSSPGPERPLTKPEHYGRFLGRRVRVRTRDSIDGRREFKGELIGADDRGVSLAGEWGTVTIPHTRIRRSNLIASVPERRSP